MRHPHRHVLAISLTALLGTAAAQNAPGGKVYCWKENGRNVCGDSLPAHAAGQARAEYNMKSGNRVAEVPRVLTPEERAAQQAAAQQAAQQAQAGTQQEMLDQVMLQSYPTEEQLRAALKTRSDGVEQALTNSLNSEKELRKAQAAALLQASAAEFAGKPVPPKVRDQVAAQHRQIAELVAMIGRQRQAVLDTRSDIEATVNRYRLLKGQQATATPVPVAAPATPSAAPAPAPAPAPGAPPVMAPAPTQGQQ